MTIEEAKDIFSEYHTGEVIDYDYVVELVVKYCNKKKPINEYKLDELAKRYSSKEDNYTEVCAGCEISSEYCDDKEYVEKAYKAGYRKANDI